MYERSAIVLERYIEKILGINKTHNLKKNQENFQELIHEIEEYQTMTEKELKVIQEFDETAKKIQELQKEQEKIYKSDTKLEDERFQLFSDLSEDTNALENKLKKIEKSLEENNEKLKDIREEFIKYLSDFSQKQKDRNKCEKARRVSEAKHIEYIKKMNEEFNEIDVKDIVNLKEFIHAEKEQIKKEALDIMIKNGKNERVSFNQDVLKKAIETRIDIAEKEAECYIITYDRMKKILAEVDSETIKLNKYNKALRDTSVKLAFLREEKEYIVGFLDYERMVAISSSTKIHKKMMAEACNNFELDMVQIKNLYELILKETTNKSTKKAYKELYNKTYLRNIEDKEKNFEQEVNNVNISMGTVINSNYWRIEGIKNIYNVFQKEVSEKFEKDLSEYKIEELEEINNHEEDYYEEYDEDYDENYDEDYEDDEEYDESYDEDYEDDEEYDEDYDEDYEDDEEDDEDYYEDYEYDEEKHNFNDEDSIDKIIERSRRKSTRKDNNKKNNKNNESKGLFDKFFKK